MPMNWEEASKEGAGSTNRSSIRTTTAFAACHSSDHKPSSSPSSSSSSSRRSLRWSPPAPRRAASSAAAGQPEKGSIGLRCWCSPASKSQLEQRTSPAPEEKMEAGEERQESQRRERGCLEETTLAAWTWRSQSRHSAAASARQ
ncbi:zinc finger protein CONSTANS-LIKE 13-like [Iris pallida]|uniref:Zinc finger protein CONSTANS-LIKE 13-like n=1 Tax=Iris pallida TaxID=29817 RepID=A0AAX6GDG2_IRIPA|nr:zinc finger protein CONSTANS-LIKE 13-like [Iris pallida]